MVKAFIVEVSKCIIVTAESSDKAVEWTIKNESEWSGDLLHDGSSYTAEPLTYVPRDWEENDFVYGDHKGDISVKDIFNDLEG